ncbi:hypothetical protein L208DRAFT_1411049 [Tricholoma matsutake]|nr:hypothetical protein L208DRAFT_1411049 [Tricholoma matsutake 945]
MNTITDESRHGDATILASGELEIQALERAMNLREVIEQLERGEVRRIRDKYGPQQGRAAHSMWPKIKVTINRRERLYHQLMDPSEFKGDKDRFFKFFATTRNLRSQKRKADDNQLEMVPYRLVVEAVPHRDKDIQEEKESTAYHDGAGSFSSELWHLDWWWKTQGKIPEGGVVGRAATGGTNHSRIRQNTIDNVRR